MELGDYMEKYLYHHGVKGMKWGVRRQQKRELKYNIKQAKKLNKQQYKQAKKKARAQYYKETSASDRAREKALEDKEKAIRNNVEEMNRIRNAYNKAYGENSYVGKSAVKRYETQMNYANSKVEQSYNTKMSQIDQKYAASDEKAYKQYRSSMNKAKDIYKQNKKKIASGNSEEVLKGKKILNSSKNG